MTDLRNPVVGAVSGHLAAYVEAFKDVESSDQGNASMWGRGHHHMVPYLKKNNDDNKKIKERACDYLTLQIQWE